VPLDVAANRVQRWGELERRQQNRLDERQGEREQRDVAAEGHDPDEVRQTLHRPFARKSRLLSVPDVVRHDGAAERVREQDDGRRVADLDAERAKLRPDGGVDVVVDRPGLRRAPAVGDGVGEVVDEELAKRLPIELARALHPVPQLLLSLLHEVRPVEGAESHRSKRHAVLCEAVLQGPVELAGVGARLGAHAVDGDDAEPCGHGSSVIEPDPCALRGRQT
jgi:hypothetical protein